MGNRMKTFIEDYIHKEIEITYHGTPLHFFSSQELFSSFELDRGSRLLLRSISEKVLRESMCKVLDAGCGIGTLGICLKSLKQGLEVDFTDRDALALLFAEYNATANNLPGSLFAGSLGINQLQGKRYDLVVSNIPAKAGHTVIEQLIKGYAAVLTEYGQAAIVIVRTLGELAEGIILGNKGRILHKHTTADYTVFHYDSIDPETADTSLAPYIRGEGTFRAQNLDMPVRTVYGLPDFEHPGYAAELSMRLLKKSKTHGSMLVFNPGQGHIPLFLLSASEEHEGRVSLAGRDLLSLLISRLNIMQSLNITVQTHHIPYLRHLEETFDFIIVHYQKEAVPSSHMLLLDDLTRLLASGGEVIITGKSAFLFRFNSLHHNFILLQDTKHKGYRACHYRKK
jgi:16S rRNA G1207 methylase RsmC